MSDEANLSETVYIVWKKPPLPVVSQRDAVVRYQVRECYIEEPLTHVTARTSIPCEIEMYKETEPGMFSGKQRMNQII